MSEETKFCKDCKFCAPNIEYANHLREWPWTIPDVKIALRYAKCTFPVVAKYDAEYLVTGESEASCASARQSFGHKQDFCGPDAIHFQPKE